jgi:hypothetical protein
VERERVCTEEMQEAIATPTGGISSKWGSSNGAVVSFVAPASKGVQKRNGSAESMGWDTVSDGPQILSRILQTTGRGLPKASWLCGQIGKIAEREASSGRVDWRIQLPRLVLDSGGRLQLWVEGPSQMLNGQKIGWPGVVAIAARVAPTLMQVLPLSLQPTPARQSGPQRYQVRRGHAGWVLGALQTGTHRAWHRPTWHPHPSLQAANYRDRVCWFAGLWPSPQPYSPPKLLVAWCAGGVPFSTPTLSFFLVPRSSYSPAACLRCAGDASRTRPTLVSWDLPARFD